MDGEVVIWTVVFLGGTILVLIGLMLWAFKKDREKKRADADSSGTAD